MKQTRILAFLLAMIMLSSALLPSCASEKTEETAALTEENTLEETLEAEEDVLDIYKENGGFDPQINYLAGRLKAEQVAALPVATNEMTYEERRQLIISYFELQLSFQWVPNMVVEDYQMTYATTNKALNYDTIYSGIPYQSLGTGNLYRWLEYYDEKTGVMDLERAFAENGGYGEGAAVRDEKVRDDGETYKKYISFITIFNQCSVASWWGWGKVLNSPNYAWTYDMNVRNGFIPVGLYTYPNMLTLDQFGEKTEANPTKYDTVNVIEDWNAANGSGAFYECYAQLKPGDVVVSNGHTMMIRTVSVKRNTDGTVDPDKSKVQTLEQKEAWSATDRLHGKPYLTQGRTEQTYSFKKLQNYKYIPFTFAELLDPNDPQDKKHLDFYNEVIVPLNPIAPCYTIFEFTAEELMEMSGPDVEKAVVFTNLAEDAKTMTYEEFENFALGSNYSISDVFVIVKDKDGKELAKNVYRSLTARIREVSMQFENATRKKDENGNPLNLTEGIKDLATGKNTLEITVQLSTGEKLTAFEGTLLS